MVRNKFSKSTNIKFNEFILSIPLVTSKSYNALKSFDSLLIIAKTLNDLKNFNINDLHDSLNVFKEVRASPYSI